MRSPGSDGPAPTRRQVLAGVGAAGAAASAGCLGRVRSLANRNADEPVSVSIKTIPDDDDPFAARVAGVLAENLRAAGVDAEVLPMERQELLRDVLINGEFDAYVARAALEPDPDALRPLVHSRFAGEPGWQNPFGYADLDVDELLVEQRRQEGASRYRTVSELQRALVRTQPFSTVAVPDSINAVRTDRFTGWSSFGVASPLTYRVLEPTGGGSVRLLLADARPTRNLNPLAVEYRNRGLLMGLLYEPLGRRLDGEIRPWLAAGWDWAPADSGESPALTLTLREGARWHDGEPLTAADVAFTYRFLADTSMGGKESSVPAPRFRGRVSLIESVTRVDRRTVRVEFVPSSTTVAARALTVPVLPAHVWRKRTGSATFAGIDIDATTTEALVWDNLDPVGSGPFRVAEVARDAAVVLERVPDHFLARSEGPVADRFGGVPVERLTVQVVPSATAGISLLGSGEADAIASTLPPTVVNEVGRAPGVTLRVRRSSSFYHVGYNNRRAPFSNPRVRRVVSRLLDRESLARRVFGGHARPARTPLAGGPWEPAGGLPPMPFLGEGGTLDAERARAAFRRIGYRYSDDGRLLGN